MKALSLLLSIAMFIISGYFFMIDFKYSNDMNFIIYMSLLIILVLIGIIGIIYSVTKFLKQSRKFKVFTYNSYSQRRIQNQNFDSNYDFLKN